MSKNVKVHALFDSGDLPDGFSLQTEFFGSVYGAASVVEPVDTHHWGTYSRAGTHVLYLKPGPDDPEYGYGNVQLTIEMDAPGYVTFWAAHAFTATADGGSFSAGANTDGQDNYRAINDTVAHDWQQYWLPLDAGTDYISWGFSVDANGRPNDANAQWLSKIEVYEGDDAPEGIGPYDGGDPYDPRAVLVARAFGPGRDGTTPSGFDTDGTIEPFSVHDPSYNYYGGQVHFTADEYVAFMLGASARFASLAVTMPQAGKVRWFDDQKPYLTVKIDGTKVIEQTSSGYNPAYYAFDLAAGAHTVRWDFISYGNPAPNYRLGRIDAWYLTDAPVLDVTAASVNGGGSSGGGGSDDGGSSGGGSSATYARSDLVDYGGSLWLSLVDANATTPVEGSSWHRLALRDLPRSGALLTAFRGDWDGSHSAEQGVNLYNFQSATPNAELHAAPAGQVSQVDASTYDDLGTAASTRVLKITADSGGTTTITVTQNWLADGDFSYDRAVSTKNQWDFAELLLDGNLVWSEAGAPADSSDYQWQHRAHQVTAGQHTVVFRLRRDTQGDGGHNALFLDNLAFSNVAIVGDDEQEYSPGDVVRHAGGLYMARAVPATEPGPGDSGDWYELVPRPVTTATRNSLDVRRGITDPFASGEAGLWIVLDPDDGHVTDFRYVDGQ